MTTKHILVVDDDEDVRNILCSILNEEGYVATGAADGIEALERMRSDVPSLVFVDLMMPRMDGKELIRTMAGDAMLAAVPIVIMSGQRAAPSDALARARAHMVKPDELDDILAVAERNTAAPVRRAAKATLHPRAGGSARAS